MRALFSPVLLSAVLLNSPLVSAQTETASPEVPRLSRDNRTDKNFGIGLDLGLFVAPVSGQALTLHYNFTKDWQFELQTWQGTWDAKDLLDEVGTTDLEKFDVNAALHLLRAKYFVGNSFYVVGGLGSRTIEFDLAASNSGERITENLKASTTVVNIGIGNQWSFDSGFFIGGEWLALSAPLSSSVSTSVSTQGTSTAGIDQLQADAADAADTLAEATTAGIVMLNLGWQF